MLAMGWILALGSCVSPKKSRPCTVKLYEGGHGSAQVEYHTPDGRLVGGYKRSFALLIGVSQPTAGWPELSSVPEELDTVRKALREHGFGVEKVLDPDEACLRSSFEGFIDRYGNDKENRLLFFVAGHGYSDGETSYLAAADAPDPRNNESGFKKNVLPMTRFIDWAQEVIKANHVLFLFDSSLPGRGFRTEQSTHRLSPISSLVPRRVRQFVTAGNPDTWGTVPKKSDFVATLTQALEGKADFNRDGFVTGTELGEYISEELTKGNAKQAPQYGKLSDAEFDRRGEFVFRLPSGSEEVASEAETQRKEQEVRAAWEQYLRRMEEEFDGVDELELPAPEMVEVWSNFLQAFMTDNPFSAKDEELRQKAQSRLVAVRDISQRQVPPPPSAPPQPAPPQPPPPPPAPVSMDKFLQADGSPLILKVVGLSDNISIVETPGGTNVLSKMEALKPYFVLQDIGSSYRISSSQEDSGIQGFVSKTEVHEWNTREGLHFIATTFQQNRRSLVAAWETEERIRRYAETEDEATYGPTFNEAAQTRVGPNAIIPYPLLNTKEITARGGATKRIHQVLVPAIVARTLETNLTPEEVQAVVGAVTFCVVFDATASMGKYARNFASTIDKMLSESGIDEGLAAAGFVLFRDIKDAQRFEIVQPMPLDEAMDWLRGRVRYMDGGDDPAEPVLDAMILAQNSFPWDGGTAVRGAKTGRARGRQQGCQAPRPWI